MREGEGARPSEIGDGLLRGCLERSPLPGTPGRGVGGEGFLALKTSPLTPTLSPEYRGEGVIRRPLRGVGV